MPLTSLTTYEAIFDRIRVDAEKDKGKSILILAGAGGVGSIAIQEGVLQSTLTTEMKGFTVDNLKKAHTMQESGKTIGKTVIVF